MKTLRTIYQLGGVELQQVLTLLDERGFQHEAVGQERFIVERKGNEYQGKVRIGDVDGPHIMEVEYGTRLEKEAKKWCCD